MKLFRASLRAQLLQLFTALAFITLAGHAAAMGGKPLEKSAPIDGQVQHEAEAMLFRTLNEIRNNRLAQALTEVNKVLVNYPNFRLPHLIRGDLLLAHSRPLREIGDAPNAPRERVQDLRDEVRLARYQFERPVDRVPKYLLQLDAGQKHAIVVDTRQSTLYVFENHNGVPRYIADYYISSGKNGSDKSREGDKKTPLGVYHVTANVPRAKLADFYGVGAFPLSYPNEWDRREGRDGNGIWLHGTPSDTYSRPPRASDGCVVLTNADLETMGKNMQVGLTPVVIADGIEWIKPDTLVGLRTELLKTVENWRRDWESRDSEAYLRHYAPGFLSGTQKLAAWSQQKRQVNAGKTWIKLKLDHISILLYPGHDNLAVVTFAQDYASNNLANQMKKRQYWINENGAWRILHEGAA